MRSESSGSQGAGDDQTGDVAATMYRAMGIDTEAMLYDRLDRPIPLLPEGRAIPGVL